MPETRKQSSELAIDPSTLLDCPFCGSRPEISAKERGIVCTSCGCKMQYDLDPRKIVSSKAWNFRIQSNDLEVCERLRKALCLISDLLDSGSLESHCEDMVKDFFGMST